MKYARIVIIAALILAAGCSGDKKSPLYEAEKDLFNARKQAGELTFPTINREFLDRALDSYRKVIEKYSDGMESVEGMDGIILTAWMELAQLEVRASIFETAREDFMHAYELAENVPVARANALWSAAFISREGGDISEAKKLFAMFHEEFLTAENILATADMNRRYLLTPIRLAEMCSETANKKCTKRWLAEAEKIYQLLIRSDAPDDLKKEARYNLVTTRLLAEDWSTARKTIKEMKDLYGKQADMPSLLYLEARVELDGFKDSSRALSIFNRIVEDHSESKEAPVALLMTGNIHLEREEFDAAASAYSRILEEYDGSGPENVEAMWQLAILEERRDNWVEASLHYKSVYTNFPTTIQGMEAPLRIAAHYRETQETEALSAAYKRAIDHYNHLASMQFEVIVRIIAEEYHVRAMIEQERWEEAASRLLVLPDMYPQYHRFKNNCLMAASIYENEVGDPDRAAEILQSCASKYAGTPLAEEAQKHFKRIKGIK